ncbi:MAG: FAD-dependent thymidylate synthase [Candidatus Riflebacteria bacterium]|nr:FAD-dependent thymidylate synthase [Candidatus Riflebacteria bacterium]
MAPEPQAYALARYSRSPDTVEASLKWVHDHSSQKFWERFYFDYGHASIADLGHVAICFEGLSELAALELLDEQTWDGQARSTRYQDFSAAGCILPVEIVDPDLQECFRRTVGRLFQVYKEVHDRSLRVLEAKVPRPSDMDPAVYDRNLAARAFDLARYMLPLGAPTALGQVVSIRTLERQIARLLESEYAEVRDLGQRLTAACAQPPDNTWNQLGGRPAETAPLAPTLARHATQSSFHKALRDSSRSVAARFLSGVKAAGGPDVHLIRPHTAEAELVSTLLYAGSNLPYAKILGKVETASAEERRWVLAEILAGRGPHDELPRSARSGYRFTFDISMDTGGWRDLHRHRRCQQTRQPFDLVAGPLFPDGAAEFGVLGLMEEAYAGAVEAATQIAQDAGPLAAHYLLPFAHRVRCLFKMDLAEVDYICRLRSGPKGHPSYRKIAYEMAEAVKVAEPVLGQYVHATPPWVEEPLER